MTYQQSAGATWRTAEWLPRLIFCCRDLPDILKFARVAARSVAPTACFYGPAGSSLPARQGDVVLEMGLVSAEQVMIEAQFASMLCADLSLACAVDVSREAIVESQLATGRYAAERGAKASGEAASAVLLTATLEGLATTPLSQAQEIPATRARLASSVLRSPDHPQLVIRVGYPGRDVDRLERTPRRALEAVLLR